MSAKDFYVTDQALLRALRDNGVEAEQDPNELHAIYGCAAIIHTSETRVDLINFDLAYQIAGYAREDDLMVTPIATVRQVIADLEPKTRHLPTRTVTFWENVGVQRVASYDELKAR